MLCLAIMTSIINPSLSVSMMLPDNNTSRSYQYIYNIEFTNMFTHDDPTIGIFMDYFYKDEYMHYSTYFLDSGYPMALRAAGGGVQLKLNTGSIVEWDFKIGYFAGGLSYPVALDSAIVRQETISRASLGAGAALNVLRQFGTIRVGIKISGNLIPFGSRPAIVEHAPPYLPQTTLNTFGVGIVIGYDSQEAP